MNTEITNVSKLVSTPVAKSNRQKDEPSSLANGLKEQIKEQVKEQGFGSNVTSLDTSKNDSSQGANKKASHLETLKSAAVAGNSLLQSVNHNLEFKVDESTKKVVIKIIDKQTGETVRQIPSEEMMAFIKKMQELDGEKGSIIQNKA
jgi:flagellar protein FlaG